MGKAQVSSPIYAL